VRPLDMRSADMRSADMRSAGILVRSGRLHKMIPGHWSIRVMSAAGLNCERVTYALPGVVVTR
jgi:hypothetical protein